MLCSKDFSYQTETQKILVENGYGEFSVHSLNFDQYYYEDEKKKNLLKARTLTEKEWEKYCDEENQKLSEVFEEIIAKFAEKYSIYQLPNGIEYKDDWDLFFYSNRGWNGKDYMTHFSFSFNKKRDPQKNMEFLEELIAFVESMEYKTIGCRVQYSAILNEEKIKEKAQEICEKYVGKTIHYCGMTGKIKIIHDENEKYGFFKKNTKKNYFYISEVYLLYEYLKNTLEGKEEM